MNFLRVSLTSGRIAAVLAIATITSTMLTACAPAVSLNAAEDSNNPGCAEVMVRLPDNVDLQQRRNTDAQSTAAWGEPASVLLRCGIPPIEVSTMPCVTVQDIDWLVDDSKAPSYRFITFARTPATEIIVDSKSVSGSSVLDELASATASGKVSRRCQ